MFLDTYYNECGMVSVLGRWLPLIVLLLLPAGSAAGPDNTPAQPQLPVLGAEKESLSQVNITLGGRTIRADIANDNRSRRQGLLGWTSITDDRGMLLDFGLEREYAIHMQGMKFPIDALWIDSGGTIRLIYDDIQPNSGLVYPSMVPCTYCLEIKAGFCRKFGVKIGQRIHFGRTGE